jgi:flavin reductase (DIM6/NTAB) family NADH-FMN oxidoreductase RutF
MLNYSPIVVKEGRNKGRAQSARPFSFAKKAYNKHMRQLWNRAPMGIWSLSTADKDGQGNMNICGYVMNISMEPKYMLLAIYHHTKTLENIKHTKQALLQLLTTDHADIVHLCGRQSGHSVDKIEKVAKKHPLATHNGLSYMKDCAGFMELHITDLRDVGGDHMLAVAEVVSSKNLKDGAILTSQYLKEHGVTR